MATPDVNNECWNNIYNGNHGNRKGKCALTNGYDESQALMILTGNEYMGDFQDQQHISGKKDPPEGSRRVQ